MLGTRKRLGKCVFMEKNKRGRTTYFVDNMDMVGILTAGHCWWTLVALKMGDFAVIFEGLQIGYTLPTQTWFISSKFFPWGSPSFGSPWLSRVFSLQEWLSECCCFWVYSLWSSCRFRLSPRHSNLATHGKNTSIQVTDLILFQFWCLACTGIPLS
jgi:hypothetical protein